MKKHSLFIPEYVTENIYTITPFLLAHIKDMTGGSSFAANLELAYNNARACSKIACAYAKL